MVNQQNTENSIAMVNQQNAESSIAMDNQQNAESSIAMDNQQNAESSIAIENQHIKNELATYPSYRIFSSQSTIWNRMDANAFVEFRNESGQVIGTATVHELRFSTSNPPTLNFEWEKKVCFWRPMNVSVYLDQQQITTIQTMTDYFDHTYCVEIEPNQLVIELEDHPNPQISFFEQNHQNRLIDIIELNEMRRTHAVLHLVMKKKLLFRGNNQLRIWSYSNVYPINRGKISEKETKTDILAQKQCLLIGPNEWPIHLDGNDQIFFYAKRSGNSKLLGTATVQLLREAYEYNTVIDFSDLTQGARFYSRHENGLLSYSSQKNHNRFCYDANDTLVYYIQSNGREFNVDANGNYHLVRGA
ncbi:hypothetical protein niasHT_011301 [Heterodera trifolii]|uniref:Uncharacterized protein n=1 Tax=Heterodera trifolii TaxID=157864 RepID=A0ABD2LA43_9BILA